MTAAAQPAELLFVTGPLAEPVTQHDVLGRLPHATPAVLPRHRRTPAGGASRGGDQRRLHPTGDPRDKVVGAALWVTERELDAVDEWVRPHGRRVRVVLADGAPAWAYLA